jgi:translation initiation factor 3 subunit F
MANLADSLFVNIGRTTLTYKVHPVVVFSVLDHYKRRGAEHEFVVGALLGEQIGATVYIRNAFPTIYSTDDDGNTVIDTSYRNKMYDLHRRVNRKETIVGWYSTRTTLDRDSTTIHQSYQKFTSDAVLMTVDTMLENFKMGIQAFTAQTFSVADSSVLVRFEDAKIELAAYAAEKLGVDALLNGNAEDDTFDAPATVLTDLENLENSLAHLLTAIEQVGEYVESVGAGEEKGDEEIGRAIVEALAIVPKIEMESFQRMFHNSVQDLLMIVYLSNLTRTQLALAQKIEGLL